MDQTAKKPEFLTRRHFLAALAASVVAAGCPLPTGMPTEAANRVINLVGFKMVFVDSASKQRFLEEKEISVDRFQLVRAA